MYHIGVKMIGKLHFTQLYTNVCLLNGIYVLGITRLAFTLTIQISYLILLIDYL
jgi:hypothetical protein